jgi:hypothetical protein
LFAGKDAAVVNVISPDETTWLMVGNKYEVTITIHNFGTDTLFTMPITFQVGNAAIYDTIIGSLAPNDNLDHTFADSILLTDTTSSYGQARVDVVGDTNHFNDAYFISYNQTGISTNKGVAVNIFPNPASHHINIQGLEGQQVQLITIDGRILKNIIIRERTIDVSALDAGVYWLAWPGGTRPIVLNR